MPLSESTGYVGRSPATTRQGSRVAWRLMGLMTLLLVIIVWLGLAAAALLTYQDLRRDAQQRLSTELALLQRLPADAKWASGSGFFVLQDEQLLPVHLQKRLAEKVTTISASTTRQLGWQHQGITGEVLAMRLPNSQPPLIVATPIAKARLQRRFIVTGLLVTLVIVVLMCLFMLIINARVARRLAYIDETANAIMLGDLRKRIPINPAIQDEYSRLALTLNAMLDKNTQLMQQLRQVNNNIAHDLKSPLNRIRSRMEVALINSRDAETYQQALAESIEDVDALLQTFQALLLMGNLEANARNYQLERISLSDVSNKLSELYTAVAEEKAHTLQSNIAEDITVFANANLFSQALGNVLDNAIKYTPEGGNICFSVSQTAATAVIVISDNGPGVPASDRETIFTRFTRLDSARQLPGTGLGMSLVRAILDVHKATIQLHDNRPGLRVEIRLRAENTLA